MSNFKHAPSNANSKTRNDYSLQLSRWFLISIGAWPQTRTSSIIERLSSIILVPMWLFMVAVITIPCLLYVFFEAKGIQTKLRPLGPLFHRIMGTLNYWILLTRGKAIHECIKHMEEDWRVTENIQNYEIMIKHAKMSRYMAGVCAMFMQGSALFFNIVGTIKTVNIVIKNETITIHPLSCPAYRKLIDARFNPANKIMLLMQFMSSYITNSSTVCICSLAIVFAMHACGQLNMLHTWFNQLVEDHAKGKHLTKRRIGNIVRHHLRVLCFIARMESIIYKACFVELTGCTLNMCLIGYYFVTNWSILNTAKIMSYIMVYISMAFNIFIFCYIGEIVTEQCKNVGQMAYMTNWYELDYKTARSFILIIVRSNNAIKITAGKLFNLSIATFGDVIKTSLAYMNVLQAMSM
ncbi:odorant receptor 82a-like [Harpegnathos saltator]|uniref:odorant receptor 82a-like n=1 Tax=Harpegnathos saltator TaxID=610380 RepID=UPI0009491263|nr:odorant receptor 82a-like [Harpegnathos saltator]